MLLLRFHRWLVLVVAAVRWAERLAHRRGRSVALAAGLVLAAGLTAAAVSAQPVLPVDRPSGAALTTDSSASPRLSLNDVLQQILANGAEGQIQQERVRQQAGRLEAAAAGFDPQLHAAMTGRRQDRPTVLANDRVGRSRTNQMTYRIGLDKQFRSGLTVAPSVELRRTDLVAPARTPYVSADVGVDLSMPLLEGRGAAVQAMAERSAAAQYRSATAQAQHVQARSALQSAVLYWNYRSAAERLVILREAESRARRFLDDARRLVAADERPAADLEQLSANLADRRAQRVAGEQAVFVARQRLGVAMNLPGEAILALPPATTPFPGTHLSDDSLRTLRTAQVAGDLLAGATERRRDLTATRHRLSASSHRLRGLRATRRPTLDLDVRVGYAGLQHGGDVTPYVQAFDTNVRGAALTIGVRYAWPLGNRQARGAVADQAANVAQHEIELQTLERTIRSELSIAVRALRQSAAEVLASREATRLYTSAVDNEGKKLRLGLSTQVDLLLIEDRLTGARLAAIDAHQRLAQALARLRFESGRLRSPEATPHAPIDARRLTTLPDRP